MAIAIIVQARVGSTRFPNKMTLPFYEKKGSCIPASRIKKSALKFRNSRCSGFENQ